MEIDKKIVDCHLQKYRNSCIPSAVELVLKLLKKMPLNYYKLQDDWDEKENGSFADFNGKTIEGVTFTRTYKDLTLEKLFEIIDQELKLNRFVIISLLLAFLPPNVRIYHAFVVYDKDNKDYKAVAKALTEHGQFTLCTNDVKKIVEGMQGTDILIYKV